MRTVIIEDEFAAAQALKTLLSEVAPDIEIIRTLQSVEESIEWFSGGDTPDIVFMDIHLADGSSFAIFDRVNIACPIIFTTAYDRYALRAFDVNSIDYLLKPIDKSHLERAVGKIRNINQRGAETQIESRLLEKLIKQMRDAVSQYKSALLISHKDKLIPLPVKKIAYIYTESKIVRAVDFDERETVIDQTLDELFSQLDPSLFYRANRQYIVAKSAVKDVSIWFNGRLSVNLSVKTPERVLVSRANAGNFKAWVTA